MTSQRDKIAVLEKFSHWGASEILVRYVHNEKGEPVPDVRDLTAHRWFIAMDAEYAAQQTAEANQFKPPLWLQQHFKWGPQRWPMYWSEAMIQASLDCGGFAALTRESLHQRGTVVYPAQLIIRYPPEMLEQWTAQWEREHCSIEWIHAPFVYHEVVAVIEEDTLRLWDSTEFRWLTSHLSNSYGGITAVRFLAAEPLRFRWGQNWLDANHWLSE